MRTRSRSAENDTDPDVKEADIPSKSAPAPEHGTRQISCHLSQLFEHSNDIRSHLCGTPEDEDEEPPASHFVPSAYWSTEEKNCFFHALAIHSRLRPDLISEEIGSKSLADVCAYVDMLEEGLLQSQEDSSDFYPIPRDNFPGAHEVSEKWEAFEDSVAETVMGTEPEARAEAFRAVRDNEIEEHRIELRAPYRPRGERALGRDREGEKARKQVLKDWVQKRELEWKQEDLLNSLNAATMKAMDMLVRETQEARALAGDTPPHPREDLSSTSQTPATNTRVHSLELTTTIVTQTADFDEELIDPLLRNPSAPLQAGTPQFSNVSRSRTPEPLGSVFYDNFNPVTPPFTRLHPAASSSTLVAPDNDDLSVEDAASAPLEADIALSPAARRRLRKRMYMRRKRAKTNGGEVDQSATRLKPGRKRKKLPGETDDPEEPTRHPRASGKTLTYKIREGLDSAGITIEWMQEENLDMFHMTGLHKLMKMYNNLHDISDSVVTEISIHTVQRLRDELVRFMVRLVQRTIVSREQEMRAKMHTKVWRVAENQVVTAANVAHALSLMGQKYADKKPLFESLLDRLGFTDEDLDDFDEEALISSPSSAKGKKRARSESASEDADDSEDDMDSTPGSSADLVLNPVSVHRAIFPPYIRLPDSPLDFGSSRSFLSHMPWTMSIDIEPNDDIDVDDDADESDDDQLEQELQQEEDLHEQDSKLDAWHEDQLWSEFGIEMAKRAVGYDGPRRRKRRRVVKTTEFVPDSEDE